MKATGIAPKTRRRPSTRGLVPSGDVGYLDDEVSCSSATASGHGDFRGENVYQPKWRVLYRHEHIAESGGAGAAG